jgi:outer membrane protein OmpA-like peptidoglycan-associated protein
MPPMHETIRPASEARPVKKGRGRQILVSLLLIVAGAVLLEIPAYLLWRRTRQLGQEAAHLSRQVEQARRDALNSNAKSEMALMRAAQAETNAATAARQRDLAERARIQSEQIAAEAQHQATAANLQAAQARREAEQLRAEREAELERLQKVLSEITNTRKTAMGLVMTLGSDSIRFDFDKATLRPGNREVLSRIAGVLMTLKGYQIYVYGYTDDIGTEQYNQKLSERRAQAVRDYLVKAGLDPNIISTKGYGESDPLVRGESAEARAKNRRVEIGIVDSVLRMQGEVVPPGFTGHN